MTLATESCSLLGIEKGWLPQMSRDEGLLRLCVYNGVCIFVQTNGTVALKGADGSVSTIATSFSKDDDIQMAMSASKNDLVWILGGNVNYTASQDTAKRKHKRSKGALEKTRA